MANLVTKPSSLKRYIQSVVDRSLRSITQSVTSSTSYLKNLVTRADADAATATAKALQTVNIFAQFQETFLGVFATDPTPATIGHPILFSAFYIRSTDGRFRYVSALDANGNPTWSDANVLPWPITPGPFTITGAGFNPSLILSNNNAADKYRLTQYDNGSFGIGDTTNDVDYLTVTSTNVGVVALTSLSTVDGQTPNVGTTGGLRVRGNGTSGTAYIQVTAANGSTQWGYMAFTSAGGLNWNGVGNIQHNGNTVWDSANDGLGSGLDADVLRGSHWTSGQTVSFGSITGTSINAPTGTITTFASTTATIGTVNSTNVTATTVTTSTLNATYVKSGIIDGTTPGVSSTGGLRSRAESTNSYAILQFTTNDGSSQWGAATVLPSGVFNWTGAGGYQHNGNTVWDSANDGVGSGLDAGLLGGNLPAFYAAISTFANSVGQSGYQHLPNGLIFQWTYLAASNGTFNFPIAFPNNAWIVMATNADSQGQYNDNAFAFPVSTTQYTASTKGSSTGYNTAYPVFIFAIGS